MDKEEKELLLRLQIKRLEKCIGAENGFNLMMKKRQLRRLKADSAGIEISPYDLNY